jgi:hypothetical protein
VKVENVHPGFTHDLVLGLVKKADLSINMNEALLRLQGQVADTDCKFYLKIPCLKEECFLILKLDSPCNLAAIIVKFLPFYIHI